MKISPVPVVLFFSLFFTACQSNHQKNEDPFAGLTYRDMMQAVFSQSDGTRLEWHGEALDQSAIDEISFQEAGSCGENDCGKMIQVKNGAEKAVLVTIQSFFTIPDFPPYTAIKMEVPAQGIATLGCSHLCLGTTEVQFSPKLVGAAYLEN